ncbi:geranylgeranylglyceryl/heptaprenylglyceryl phosphate synthase [Flavicella sp.]|uniref:geranylgeranylglyceryl/heptaprenylglyceryl phosphate synthase n=1 Tax=Flavicella sp. TaxID=2957742 RepID=UPI0030162DE1
MKNSILHNIIKSKKDGKKLLAVLLDPDKIELSKLKEKLVKINQSKVNYIFIGGSTVAKGLTEKCVVYIKQHTKIPVILFPGDYNQLTPKMDAVLFLTLISGRNPEYLIEQQIQSIPFLERNKIECISTGYILINGGTKTATQTVSNTNPISQKNIQLIEHTALAGQYLGNQLIYLEAGSGAKQAVSEEIIKIVSKKCTIPIIVGGGLRSITMVNKAFDCGADLVVIGTAFEKDNNLFDKK